MKRKVHKDFSRENEVQTLSVANLWL